MQHVALFDLIHFPVQDEFCLYPTMLMLINKVHLGIINFFAYWIYEGIFPFQFYCVQHGDVALKVQKTIIQAVQPVYVHSDLF
ncbi:hypothetical protein BS614_06490 [Paenibacillus xylanexedens]|nr:hypothetical protein BS614_06490 [Paenibacillus xylanexedens]